MLCASKNEPGNNDVQNGLKFKSCGCCLYSFFATNQSKNQSETSNNSNNNNYITLNKSDLTKRKTKYKKPIQGDQTDVESSNFTGKKTEKSCNLTGRTCPPCLIIEDILSCVDGVCCPYDGQVDPHQEVSKAQVGDKHSKRSQGRSSTIQEENH